MAGLPISSVERFEPFTAFHAVVVFLCALTIIAACTYGTRVRGTPAEVRFRITWALATAGFQLFAAFWRLFLREGPTPPDGNLPLQVCRIAPWVAVFALLTMARPWRAVLYFWGMGLCVHGFLTPMRFDGGLRAMDFWLFWVGHLQIVGSAVYDLVVHRFRPGPADLRTALFAGWAYAALVIPLNLAFDWDYGYLGRGRYRTRNIVDLLPWPWRPALLIAIVWVWFIVLRAVWCVPQYAGRFRRPTKGGRAAGAGPT